MSNPKKPLSDLADAYLRQSWQGARKTAISWGSYIERLKRGEFLRPPMSEDQAFALLVEAAHEYRKLGDEIARRDSGRAVSSRGAATATAERLGEDQERSTARTPDVGRPR